MKRVLQLKLNVISFHPYLLLRGIPVQYETVRGMRGAHSAWKIFHLHHKTVILICHINLAKHEMKLTTHFPSFRGL